VLDDGRLLQLLLRDEADAARPSWERTPKTQDRKMQDWKSTG